jgi:hypothetical protein
MFPFTIIPASKKSGATAYGAIQLPALLASGIAQVGKVAYGSASLLHVIATGAASKDAAPIGTFTNPATSPYEFDGGAGQYQNRTVAGTANGNGGTIASITYSVTGVVTQSGSLTVGATWSFSITNMPAGRVQVNVTITNTSGTSTTITAYIRRRNYIDVDVTGANNYAFSIGGKFYWKNNITNYRYYLRRGGVRITSLNTFTTSTGNLSMPSGYTIFPASGYDSMQFVVNPRIIDSTSGVHDWEIILTDAYGSWTYIQTDPETVSS